MPPSCIPVVSASHLVVQRLTGITHQAHTSGTTRTNPESEGSSMTHSTRVALHDPRGVSTIPLTNPPSKHRTIFSCASTKSQDTKPSRRWQLPRVTSTTGLQLDHLVPLDAITQCNALEIAHFVIGSHFCKHELQSSQTKHTQAWTQSPPRCSPSSMAETPFYL